MRLCSPLGRQPSHIVAAPQEIILVSKTHHAHTMNSKSQQHVQGLSHTFVSLLYNLETQGPWQVIPTEGTELAFRKSFESFDGQVKCQSREGVAPRT